ncbi:DUF481 domain-containing protein [Pelagicoccus albus]|uniref:DUF481 domain-containing protein n=1 Tax=Pelagicoccus albus TaxID=415222 RepID=A0A7X1E8T4_9BACT|nr:DUF481 domain-containing protein [Pelagicoccus albus]MBC2606468.1 DUF481 domain-containing protein [Pelagicoccus albus]
MSRILLCLFILKLALGWTHLGAAETELAQAVLDNGDRLSGILLSQNEKEVDLQVDYLGKVVLPRDRIVDLIISPSVETLAERGSEDRVGEPKEGQGPPPSSQQKEPMGERPEKQLADSEETSEEAVNSDGSDMIRGGGQVLDPPKRIIVGVLATLSELEEGFNPLPAWTKQLQFGFNSLSGRQEQSSLNYSLQMSRKIEKNQLNFNAAYDYGEADNTTTLDKLATRFRWRKDIGPGIYYESQSDYSSDSIKLIDSNIEQKFGLGTRFIDNTRSSLSAGLGASGRWRNFADDQEDEVAYLLNLSQDWDYKVTEKVALKQDFTVAMPLEQSEDYEVNFAASLSSAVTKSINFSIRFQFGFDNSLEDDLKEDRRIISSLGYSF